MEKSLSIGAVALGLAMVATGCGDDGSGTGGVDDGPTEPWVEHPCEMPIPAMVEPGDLRCATLGAPVQWNEPEGRKLAVEVAVLGASGEATEPPLVFFGGGPGIPNLDNYLQAQAPRVLRPIRENRDIVFFDPRGSGRSVPSLPCQEVVDAVRETYRSPTRSQSEFREAYLDAYRACRARLEDEGNVDFDAFHSAHMARDVIAMMDELGYGEFDVYGLSYGGRLAQVMVRDHADRVRAAIVDSSTLVETSFADAWPANFERSLDALFDACAASESCSEDHPDLEGKLFEVVADLNAEPVEVPVGGGSPLFINGYRLLLGLHGVIYDADNAGFTLLVLDQLAARNIGLLTAIAPSLLPSVDDRADGQYASVLCAEEVAFDTPESIAAAHAGVRDELVEAVGSLNGEIFAEMCDEDIWPVTPRPAVERQPVISDVPTLVLTGGLDPVMQPSSGERLVQGLSRGQSVNFPPFAHGVLRAQEPGEDEVPCAQAMILEFLADPSSPVDTSCVDTLPPVFP